MDTNRILLILAGFSGVLVLARSLRSRTWGFVGASLPVVLTAAAGAVFFVDTAGYIAAVIFGISVLLPLFGQRLLVRLLSRQRYGAAARFASVLRFLHPADGWWERPRLYHALDLGQKGRTDEASAVLSELDASGSMLAREARVHLLRMRGRWEDVVAWLEEQHQGPAASRDPSLLPLHLRALGEIGEISRLVLLYAESEPRLERGGLIGLSNLCRLFVFAFTGRAERVTALFQGPLADYSSALQTFWRETAELTLAPDGPARAALSALLEKPDAALHVSVRRRLDHRLADPREALSPSAASVLTRIEQKREQEERYGPVARGFRPYATFGLMAPILAMFAAEALCGGTENVDALYALGAVWPKAVLAGEWWRLGAATLLHFGTLHLVMNLGGLYVLGPYVEFALGRARYVIVYLFAGIGTMFAIVLLSFASHAEPQLLVGASGAIMGLVGATGAVMWRARRIEGSTLARRRLVGVVLILVTQSIFDLLTPEVSFLSHFGGALLGFLLASGMAHRVTPQRRRS
jgi:rhomboid protease GluP